MRRLSEDVFQGGERRRPSWGTDALLILLTLIVVGVALVRLL